ncbi:MAG: family 10 glycosylhydrolase [Lentisphaeria bacterium]|nr:family 10 glycosylhydrolase [Lentisphaeria bacterium]
MKSFLPAAIYVLVFTAFLAHPVAAAPLDPIRVKSRIVTSAGAAPPVAGTAAGRKCLNLVSKFATADVQRCYWDIPFDRDLREANGVYIRFRCSRPGPVSQFNVYLRSRGVWHAATFSTSAPGQWEVIRIGKAGTRPEGISKGWRRVDTIRIAAWRGSRVDTAMQIADIGVLKPTLSVAVLRSAVHAAGGERSSVYRATQRVTGALAHFGQRPAIIEDIDLDGTRISRFRLILLPYCPSPPPGLVRTLSDYVARGGKIVGFYSLPPRLGTALGFGQGRYLAGSKLGPGLGGIVFAENALHGAPSHVVQPSRNISTVVPAGHDARHIAWWYDIRGKTTKLPAITESKRGIWMSHIYMGKDRANGARMIAAMTGRFVPELWRGAADHRLREAATSLSFPTIDTALKNLRADAQPKAAEAVRRALAKAERFHRATRNLMKSGSYTNAIDFADKCAEKLQEAYFLKLSGGGNEFRGAWCHRGYGIDGWTWDQTVRRFKDSGFNALFPYMANAAEASYPSRHLARTTEAASRGDLLAACAKACQNSGIALHVWVGCLYLGDRPGPALKSRLAREGRLQRTRSGTPIGWLCPSHPKNRKMEAAIVTEIATRYPVKGIHLDFIRYRGANTCYCPTCRTAFERTLGKRVARWPQDLGKSGELRSKWLDFRRQRITSLVVLLGNAARTARPGVQVSAAVYGNWASARDSVGQDWVHWARLGLLDFVCPMDYASTAAGFSTSVARQARLLKNAPTKLYPGIGLSSHRLDAVEFVRQVNVTRQYKTGGFMAFEYNRAEAVEVLPGAAKALVRTTR